MTCYDLFNGDADGICALQQLRLQSPRESVLVTGLKRDIDLLNRIEVDAGDEVTVLDISLDKNREALKLALDRGASVFYADHHYPGEVPRNDNLTALIDVTADTCTSLIVNQFLANAQAKWAVVGAYGDNLDKSAEKLGRSIGLHENELSLLQQLGICLNYNGYGFELTDLMYHPEELYRALHSFTDPIEFATFDPKYRRLLEQYESDMEMSRSSIADSKNQYGAVYHLPDEAWAKRIVGVMGNDLAKQYPDRAHALLVDMGGTGFRVSVRAPYNRKQGADDLCRQFESGGGRKAAAGINCLDCELLDDFVQCFYKAYDQNI